MLNKPKLISKEDTIFLAGHRGMAGRSILKALKIMVIKISYL